MKARIRPSTSRSRALGALLLAWSAAAAAIPAQTAYISYAGSGAVIDTVLPNDACGPTYPQVQVFGGGSFCAGTPPLLGGLALDQTSNWIFETNGTSIIASPSPLYPTTCTIAAVFTGGCGLGVGALSIGFASGMAIQPDCPGGSSTLWVTDGTSIIPVDVATALPLGGPFPVSPLPGSTFLTGLEFDWAAGDLIACAADGSSYRISVTSLSEGTVTATIAPPASWSSAFGPATCNILDRGAGGTGSYYICDGPMVHPVSGTYASEVPFFSGVSQAPGASFSAEPVLLPSGCDCGGIQYGIRTSQPVVCGLPPSFDIYLVSSPPQPSNFAWLLLDVNCCPYVFPALFDCNLWVCPATAVLLGPFITDGNGVAIGFTALTLPCVIGFTAYAQWAYLCPSSPFGLGLTDAMHMRISHR